jgi:hypothetical protein
MSYHTLLALVVRQLTQFIFCGYRLLAARLLEPVAGLSCGVGSGQPFAACPTPLFSKRDVKWWAARAKQPASSAALVRPGIPVVPWRTASSAASARSHSAQHARLFNPLGP